MNILLWHKTCEPKVMNNVKIDNKNTTIIILVGMDQYWFTLAKCLFLECYQHFYLAFQVHSYQQQPAWEQTTPDFTRRKIYSLYFTNINW